MLVGAMAMVVLLIACANVANLHLARAMRRRREVAVRLALGVSMRRLLSQLITESIILTLVGGIVGLVAGQALVGLLRGVVTSSDVPAPLLDPRTIGFTACALIVTGILAAVGPVVMARGHEVTRHLRAGIRGHSPRSRVRAGLLVVQTALSVLLLVGAALFVRSLGNVRHQPLGFDPAGLLYVETRMADVRLPPLERASLRLRLLETARRLPLVERAALTGSLPIADIAWGSLRVPGIDSMVRMRMPDFYQNSVGPGYFAVMRTRILRGRPIDAQDAAGARRSVVVSDGLAKLLWPGQEALGKCVYVDRDSTCTSVVGVAEDIHASLKAGDAAPYYYVATAQNRPELGRGLILRMRGDLVTQVEQVRAALQREMPGASYVTVAPYERIIDQAAHSWRLGATMFVLFAALAVALAAVGLYGLITYDVAQRTHEIGVRMALGACVADVLWLVLREGLAVGAAGVVIGTGVTLVGAGRIAGLLFGISAREPAVYALVGAGMLFVALVASLVPAHRAASVDPNTALRAE
jgi:predicted permease